MIGAREVWTFLLRLLPHDQALDKRWKMDGRTSGDCFHKNCVSGNMASILLILVPRRGLGCLKEKVGQLCNSEKILFLSL